MKSHYNISWIFRQCVTCRKMTVENDEFIDVDPTITEQIKENFPIMAISHGYCPPCGEEEFRKIEELYPNPTNSF